MSRLSLWIRSPRLFPAVFLIGLVLRLVVAVWLNQGSAGMFLDDATYLGMASDAATGKHGVPGDYTSWLFTRTALFLWPLVALFRLFGPSEMLAQVYVALLGAFAAAFVARATEHVGGRAAAVTAGLAVAMLPSQVLWSSLVLKDSTSWMVLTALAWIVAVTARQTGWRIVGYSVLSATLVASLGWLRLHTMVVVCWAFLGAALAARGEQRLPRVAVALPTLLFLPMLFQLGPAGVGLAAGELPRLDETRENNASGARTAYVEVSPRPAPPPSAPASSAPDDAPPRSQPVLTPVAPVNDSEPARSVEWLPRGLTMMLLYPYPWTSVSGFSMRAAQWETVLLWYPLLALAVLGLWTSRRRLDSVAFPVLAGGGLLVVYSLAEGNFGTAFRHRGEFVWAVAMLAGLGVRGLLPRLGPRRG